MDITLEEALKQKFGVSKHKGGINSPFNDAVARVQESIKDMNWSFGRWCGYLKNIPVHEIQSMIASAEKDKNVGSKFLWLVKQYKLEKKV